MKLTALIIAGLYCFRRRGTFINVLVFFCPCYLFTPGPHFRSFVITFIHQSILRSSIIPAISRWEVIKPLQKLLLHSCNGQYYNAAMIASSCSCYPFSFLILSLNSFFPFTSSGFASSISLFTRLELDDAKAISTSDVIWATTVSAALCRSVNAFRVNCSIFCRIFADMWGNSVPFVMYPCTVPRWRADLLSPDHGRKYQRDSIHHAENIKNVYQIDWMPNGMLRASQRLCKKSYWAPMRTDESI